MKNGVPPTFPGGPCPGRGSPRGRGRHAPASAAAGSGGWVVGPGPQSATAERRSAMTHRSISLRAQCVAQASRQIAEDPAAQTPQPMARAAVVGVVADPAVCQEVRLPVLDGRPERRHAEAARYSRPKMTRCKSGRTSRVLVSVGAARSNRSRRPRFAAGWQVLVPRLRRPWPVAEVAADEALEAKDEGPRAGVVVARRRPRSDRARPIIPGARPRRAGPQGPGWPAAAGSEGRRRSRPSRLRANLTRSRYWTGAAAPLSSPDSQPRKREQSRDASARTHLPPSEPSY